jgi:flavin reductase (DIM6/NTAB) family NADH-FMN oxidoreductase RutF
MYVYSVASREYSRENILREREFTENILSEIISREFSRIFFLLGIKHR